MNSIIENLTESQIQIYNFVCSRNGATSHEVKLELDLTMEFAYSELKILHDYQLIKQIPYCGIKEGIQKECGSKYVYVRATNLYERSLEIELLEEIKSLERKLLAKRIQLKKLKLLQ